MSEPVTHKDFLGNPIKVGDTVIVTPKNYRGFVMAKVASFAKTQLNLVYYYEWQPKKLYKYRVTTDSVIVAPQHPSS